MITQQTQIKITLPVELKEFIESKARKFGLPIASYVRHLIVKDVEDMDYPVYEASDKAIRAYKKAKKEQKEGKLIRVDNLDKFFDGL